MLDRFDRWLVRCNRAAVIALLAAMACMVFANVVLRYVSGNSILWVEEASRYVMIWLTFVGCGLVLRYGGHIGVDTLQDRLPRHAAVVRALIWALLLGFFATMVWLGIVYSTRTWIQTTPVMQIPVGAVYLAMPIGFGLMIVHLALMARPYIARKEFMHGAEFDADAVKM
ncbi:MAG TPA: TRAP transporter small permease [Casimicrobiaceae bacterium]|nr:TRAP transporter small permease [Casimicrobiaceae bacterium]